MAFSFRSLVFPFNFQKKYSVGSLVDQNQIRAKDLFFSLKNTRNRGQFFLDEKLLKQRELKRIAMEDLDNIFYQPLFPKGTRKSSALPVESVNGQRMKVNPFGEQSKKLFKDDLVDKIKFVSYNPGKRKTSDVSKARFFTRRDWAPDAIGQNIDYFANRAGECVSLSELVSLYDYDGEKVKKFTISDLDPSGLGGYLKRGGVDFNGRSLGVLKAKDLSSVEYVIGKAGSRNRISISAGSKRSFGDELIISLNTLSNVKPSVEIDDNEFSREIVGEQINIKRLISIRDPEEEDLVVKIIVESDSPFPGFLVAEDQRVPLGETYETTLSALSDLKFQVGRPGSSSDIQIGVVDEEHLVTKNVEWKTIANNAPAITLENVSFAASTAGKEQSVSSYFNYHDPEGDSIREIGFIAQGGDGYFVRKGNQYRNKIVYFPLEELPKVHYVPGPQASTTRVGIAVRDEWGDEQMEIADWSVLSEDSSNSAVALDLYERINSTQLPSFDVLMSSDYVPNSRLARKFLGALSESHSQSFSLGLNKSWNLGEILDVPNQKDYSFFIGPDKTFSWRGPSGSGGGGSKWGSYSYAMGINQSRFKAGLQVDGGFGLGSLELKGGINSRLDYSPDFGITLSSSTASASLGVTYPYAYLDVEADANLTFKPYLRAKGCLAYICPNTGNLLEVLNLDNKRFGRSLVDIDTRDVTGSSYGRSFSWGPFSTTARIPRFSSSGVLDDVPPAFADHRLWGSDASGAGVAYGISGLTSLFEFNASLGQLITDLFQIPLLKSFSFSKGPLSLSGAFTLADASVNASTDLSYELSSAYKNNFYVQVEGGGDVMPIWDPAKNLTMTNFADLDENGYIKVSIHSDPIIGVQAKVGLDSNLGGSFEFLSASGSLDVPLIPDISLSLGPVYQNTFDLGRLGNVNLFDELKMWRLSDLAPEIQSQLSATVNVPIA